MTRLPFPGLPKWASCARAIAISLTCAAIAIGLLACQAATPPASGMMLIGAQTGSLVAGIDGTATYTVTTANIASGTVGSLSWYADAAGTTTAAGPKGIGAVITNVVSNTAIVTMNAGAETSAGTYYFVVSFGSVSSSVAALKIAPASTPTIKVGAQAGTIVNGRGGSVSFAVATTNVAAGTAGTITWYSTADASMPVNAPSAINAIATSINNGSAVIGMTVTATAFSQAPYFTITYGPATSSVISMSITPDWVLVGQAGFGITGLSCTSMAISADGIPFISLNDGPSGKANVMKYADSQWKLVGPANFSPGLATLLTLALSPSGVPYVAYKDAANGDKATVLAYKGTSWAPVGSAGFSAGAVYESMSFAFSPSGLPYIAYEDAAKTNRLTVMKYDGANWVYVGAAGFSPGIANWINLAFSSAGVPYVAFQNNACEDRVSVMKFNGESWDYVGPDRISSSWTHAISLALSSEDVPYIAFSELSNNYRGTVMRYENSSWTTVGAPGFSSKQIDSTSIRFSPAGLLHLLYSEFDDSTTSWACTLVVNNDARWTAIGSPSFAVNGIARAFALSSSGIPYIAFTDAANSNTETVMLYR